MRSMLNSCLRWITDFFALFTQAKSFKDNAIIGNSLLNRLGLHILRLIIAHSFFYLRQQSLFFLISRDERQQLRQQGFLLIPNALDQQSFTALSTAFDQVITNDMSDLQLPNKAAISRQGDTVSHAQLLVPELQQLTGITAILNSPAILNRLRYASGTLLSPWFYFLRIKNTRLQGEQDPQKTAHADAFHPTMKAWLFTHEVSSENGPFCYYPGSHRLSLKRIRWEYRQSLLAKTSTNRYTARGSFRLSEADRETLDLAPMQQFTVPANSLIVANTYGFHCRGKAAADAQRDSLWASAWRAPFIPLPLPDNKRLRAFFYRKMQNKLLP